MFSSEQKRKAEKCEVVRVGDGTKNIFFKVIYTDAKGEQHEHQVDFNRTTKKLSCDCKWCSYYGLRPKSRNKKCYNCLAVMKLIGLD